ncbi:MAG: ribosome recycling factor [Bacteriovoracaceae bacterium]|jgi:ribosome recycling factor|nr:ribosome recycling factor [Bacteriovoracaceae bacterium]
MMDEIKVKLEEGMTKSIKSLQHQFTRVRTGRASASVLDGVSVDYYGTPTPIKQVGQISTPEARLLQIQPFDKTLIGEIEKAIINANLGLTPGNDGNFIRIQFPALTEETRKDLVKQIKKHGEDAKVSIRNVRREQNDVVKKAEKAKEITEDDVKNFLDQIQKITDKFIAEVDTIVTAKEKDLMTV